MEIHDDICYFKNWSEKTIERFDLNNLSYMESVKLPSKFVEAVRIYDDYLYFIDYENRTLYRFSMADLNL
ncbi:MAG: hypothetical protein KAR38_12350 [Calditrichia bacterium]|nr:hypothetical protein [Calditrichia bacterium]